MPIENPATESQPTKNALGKFADFAQRLFSPGTRLLLDSGAAGPQTLEWALDGLYPDALAPDMAPLARIGAQAIEFFPNYSGGAQQGYRAVAHLKTGRRLRLSLNDLDLSAVTGSMAGGSSSLWASGAFLNWACHNKVVFAEKPGEGGAWRIGRRRANVSVDASGEPDLLMHPQAWNDSEIDRELLYTRAAMKDWWFDFSSQVSARIIAQLPESERQTRTTGLRKPSESAILDEKIAAAFPASMRGEAKAALEKRGLSKEVEGLATPRPEAAVGQAKKKPARI